MDLREKVARVACEVDCGRVTENELARCQDIADAILAIPEIAEALHYHKCLITPGMITIESGPSMLSPYLNNT